MPTQIDWGLNKLTERSEVNFLTEVNLYIVICILYIVII